MYPVPPVTDLDWLNRADLWKVSQEQVMPCTAEELFSALEEPQVWKDFMMLNVEWTSKLGENATRTIGAGPVQAEEQFFVWEAGKRFAFTFVSMNVDILNGLVEEWTIDSVDGEPGKCVLRWRMGFETKGIPGWLAGPLMYAGLQFSSGPNFRKLAAIMKKRSRKSRG